MLRITFLAFLAASAAQADPAYFRVTGVAADDTLNVRAEPDGGSADIGDLPHDATRIEVIAEQDGWGRIIWQEGNGWVALRFMEPDVVETIADTALPVGLLCGGTEPFWSIRLTGDGAVYSDISGTTHVMTLGDARISEGRPDFPVAIRVGSESASALSIIQPQSCGDGMSDRDYGYSLVQMLRTEDGERFMDGCCNLPLDIGAH